MAGLPGEEPARARPRLAVADDNPLMLDQVVLLLSPSFDIVARSTNGQSAVDAVARLHPDAVVLDITMPVMDGLRAAARLRELSYTLPIVFLTVHDDEEFVRAARAAGGLGYVVKSRMATDLRPAIEAALAGRPFVSAPPG